MLLFALHSLFRAYGWHFLFHMALPHPLRTFSALRVLRRLDFSGNTVDVDDKQAFTKIETGEKTLVGAGFCLKPLDCPSGRFNHACLCLESASQGSGSCSACEIRQYGQRALQSGCSFYIMTSARDILYDIWLPSLQSRRFTSGIFFICRYSFLPFALGLVIAGIRGRLIAFKQGDCRDYRTWVQADVGIKKEQTVSYPQSVSIWR